VEPADPLAFLDEIPAWLVAQRAGKLSVVVLLRPNDPLNASLRFSVGRQTVIRPA
jgi:hypothetical protein